LYSAAASNVYKRQRFGRPKQYIEPFCGSAAMLLAAPAPASLEVICDANFYVANFWRAIKYQPDAVIEWQDYPVSHVDLYARHRWLTEPERVARLRDNLIDPEWPGDPQIAGWWVWGQCAWIGAGWCDPDAGPFRPEASDELGKRPHVSNAGRGVQSLGKRPHTGNAGCGVHAVSLSKIPRITDGGCGVQATGLGQIPFLSSSGMDAHARADGAAAWLHALSRRLARVRIIHGDWRRCLNSHYGGAQTAIFLDPPYLSFEKLYGSSGTPVALEVAEWAREHAHLRIALCGLSGDYDLPGWETYEWSRGRLTYGSTKTTDDECIWFSPACLRPAQPGLFDRLTLAGKSTEE
ncbi:MAG: DNA adenine methylase, partial [Pseudomonadota bacterium]